LKKEDFLSLKIRIKTPLLALVLLFLAAITGCNNPFSIKKEVNELNQMLTDTYNIAASGPIPLPPLEP